MSDGDRQQALVSGSAVMAAGTASTLAALVTSKFGVAGTLLGAALTTMIITGGSAILRAYFESAAGKVREAPRKFRSRAGSKKSEGFSGYPGQRHNFFVRFQNALSWFSYLPKYKRRPILVRGLIAAVGAFIIGMAVVTVAEASIGNSFSCGFWGKCPTGAVAGVHIAGSGTGAGAEPSLLLSRPKSGSSSTPVATPTQEQSKGLFENLVPGSNSQQNTPQPVPGQQQVQPSQPTPGQQPVPGQQEQQPSQPLPGQEPAQPSQSAQPQPAQPSQPATPAPGGQPPAASPPTPSSGGAAGQQQPSSP